MHVHIEERLLIDQSEDAKDTLNTAPGDMADPLWGARIGPEAVSWDVSPMDIAGHPIATHRCTANERRPSE